MKLLSITRLYWPHVGGADKHIRGRNMLLLKKGFKISTITEKYDESLRDEETIDGEKIIRLSYPKIKLLGLLVIWFWIFRKRDLIRQADIIHIHDVFIWYLPFRFIFPSKPVYTTFHGWEGIYPIPKKFVFLKKLAAKLSVKNICIGKFIEKYYGIKADKIMLTPFKAPKRDSSDKEKKALVYVGRMEKDTGLSLILKSLSYLKGYKIDFCGDGPLLEECKKYGNVHGVVDPKPFYRKATISLSAGYNSVMEALSFGCLVITTYDNPLKRDYLKMTPFAKWIIIRKSPKKMAEAIEYYTSNPEKANYLIDGGYKWMKSQTWEKLTDQYLELWGIK